MIDNNKVVAALREVEDPVAGSDIISTRRVSELRIDGNNVTFKLDTGGMAEEAKTAVYARCEQVVTTIYPDAQVHVHMQQSGQGAGAGSPLGQVTNIIAVASGKGGVGKSTVSVNLAMGLHKAGLRVGLIDADLYGPSVPTMLGLEGERPRIVKRYGANKILPLERDGMPVMSIGFIVEPEQAVILRGPRLAGIIKQFMFECVWPELDYLIIDLPPGTGDIQLTLVQTVPVTGAIMVTTPQQVAVADALKAANMFRMSNINVPILGVVENMSWFTPEELPENKYFLFGKGGGSKLAELIDSRVIAQIPLVQSVGSSADQGRAAIESDNSLVASHFTELADRVVHQVNERNARIDPTERVKVQ